MPKRKDRKLWFRGLKGFLKLFIWKPKFKYLGQKPNENSIILSNHVGAAAPVLLELYYDVPFRFWGTYEMTSSVKEIYKYLSTTYFVQKKHWKKWIAKTLCVIIAPLVKIFYRGMRLIPTYPDVRFKHTIKESLETLDQNKSLIIFPEDSKDGYHDKLIKFYAGFYLLCNHALKLGKDLMVHLSYYVKHKKIFIIDKGERFSVLRKKFNADKEALSKHLCDRENTLKQLAGID